jgi:hypothetical protein
MDVEPRDLGPDHEVKIGLAAGICIESAEAEPENLRRCVIALEDRRTAAPREESMHPRAGLPALEKIFSSEKNEIGGLDPRGGAKAGS